MTYTRLERDTEKPPAKLHDWTAKWEALPAVGSVNGDVADKIAAFCRAKGISVEALEALGTRVAHRKHGAACFAWAGYNLDGTAITALKYRPIGGSSHDSETEKPSYWFRPIVAGKRDALDWLVVEGESDGARLYDLVGGAAAILILPSGARAFRRSWADVIPRGATVYLAHDNDADGDAGALKASNLIGGKTVRLRPPDEAGDWCEWRGDRTAFLAYVAGVKSDTTGLEPLDLTELLAGDPPPVAWLWEGWLARSDLALIVADPKVGKSLLALGLAAAARKGERFLDAVCARISIGILDFENPLDEAHKRLRHFQVSADDNAGIAYFHMPRLNLQQPEAHAALAAVIERYELDLLVVDSLRRGAPGLEENESAAVSAVFSPLRVLSATTGCAILVVHHARKRVGDNPTEAAQMVRGSGDLVASVDTLLYLRAKESGTFVLEHAASRRGLPHEPILVRIEGDEDELRLVNEGPVAMAEDKVEAMLAKIMRALAEAGGPLQRNVLALRVDADTSNSSFTRALNLGYSRNQLAKQSEGVGKPTFYALAPGVTYDT